MRTSTGEAQGSLLYVNDFTWSVLVYYHISRLMGVNGGYERSGA